MEHGAHEVRHEGRSIIDSAFGSTGASASSSSARSAMCAAMSPMRSRSVVILSAVVMSRRSRAAG
jgi:hypothetical protein